MYVYIYIYYCLHWQHHWTQSIFPILSALCSSAFKSKPQKNNPQNLYFNQSWISIGLFFFWSFCLFWFWVPKQKSKVQTTLNNIVCCPDVFKISAWHLQHELFGKQKPTVSWRWAHVYSATPLDIIQVCLFCWLFHGLGTLTDRYWKPWEKNASQPRLEYIYLIECLNFICFLCWVRAPRAPPFYTPKRAREPNQKMLRKPSE